MGFFITRYISTFFIFVIGIKAPGIIKRTHDFEIEPLTDNQQDVNRSSFHNAWFKLKSLLPFLWPKKEFWLQFRVIVCVLLLIGGRVINLYVPIYSKKIVDSLSVVPAAFRWDYVVIYVGFKFLQGGGTGE